MKKNHRKQVVRVLVISLLVIGILGSATIVLARNGQGRGDGMPLMGLWALDLSSEQKAAIGSMLPAYREEKQALRDQLHAARETMQTLMAADKMDEEGIREASRAMAPLMEEMAVLRARFVFDLKGILSPEQVEQLQEQRKHGRKQWQKKHQFHQEMMDAWLQMPANSAN